VDSDTCYRALVAHDERFDGLFFVGVTTTGIYCRPVCRARTPRRDRTRFFRTAAEAEAAGFRACFRCRPELAPGAAPVDAVSRLVAAAARRIDEGALSDGAGRADGGSPVEALAGSLGVTGRHLRRAMQAELGVAPLALAASRRLALARQLVMDTRLPMTEVAFASGFASVRRFNAVLKAELGRPPTALRRMGRKHGDGDGQGEVVRLTLAYRPPYDWPAMLAHFAARAIPGVEAIDADGGAYLRTVRIGGRVGWLSVEAVPGQAALRATISHSLTGALMAVVARLRRQLDLDADPAAIAAHLGRDPRLAAHVQARPGLRVAGAFDPFEASARAVIGQQISVAAARTIAGRLAVRLGTPISTLHAALTHLFPDAAAVAGAADDALGALGIPRRRAQTLRSVAAAVATGALSLDAGGEPERLVERLAAMAGLGPWTAHYLAMRAFGWPDAFPEADLGLRKALGGVSARAARAAAEPWRPWRAYGATYLWTSLVSRPTTEGARQS
jgi:AraC family transcriptional regulator of adaptative response / DNA-3-methyladenine glycosylase II